MSEGMTTSKLPPIKEHEAGKQEPAITTNKVTPVWPIDLGEKRERFTGKDIISTGNIEKVKAAQVEIEKKGNKGK